MAAPPEIHLDAEGRESVVDLLALRTLVWSRLPEAAAKHFDEALYCVQTVVETLRSLDQVESERNMAWLIERALEEAGTSGSALREAGETAAADALRKAMDGLFAPAREHLARVRAASRAIAGRNAIVDLMPREYLFECADCGEIAERLRMVSDHACFTRGTGAVSPPYLSLEQAGKLFNLLEKEGAAAFCHEFELQSKASVIGYCPECRALYCPAHYETRETWSGSWLEALHGTCAKGHRRELA